MKENNPIHKAITFIAKNTKTQNESIKLIVVVRILIMSMILYVIVSGILCSRINPMSILLFSLFLAYLLIIFILSYYVRTHATICLYNIGIIIGVIILAHYLGWNTGVQNFIMVLLVQCFFTSYRHYGIKMVYACFLCGLRMELFFLYKGRVSNWQLSSIAESNLQIVNTLWIFWCLSVIAFIFSKDGQELEARLVEYNNQLKKLANTDTLTGLNNRRRAIEYMNLVVEKELDKTGFSICICDIDHFKIVNDKYGHDFGDEVLISIAKVFKEEITGRNFVARWGGEEFLILFPECNGDDAFIKLEHIRRKIKEMIIRKDNIETQITLTYGLAEYDYKGNVEATLKEADEKLYLGKEQGRDVIIY